MIVYVLNYDPTEIMLTEFQNIHFSKHLCQTLSPCLFFYSKLSPD